MKVKLSGFIMFLGLIALAFALAQTPLPAHGFFDNLNQSISTTVSVGEWETLIEGDNIFNADSDSHNFDENTDFENATIIFRITSSDGITQDFEISNDETFISEFNLDIVLDRNPPGQSAMFEIIINDNDIQIREQNSEVRDINILADIIDNHDNSISNIEIIIIT